MEGVLAVLVLPLPLVRLVSALGFFFCLGLAIVAGVVCDDDVGEVYWREQVLAPEGDDVESDITKNEAA